jgi:DNA/RNA endonuclease G (NUC1)
MNWQTKVVGRSPAKQVLLVLLGLGVLNGCKPRQVTTELSKFTAANSVAPNKLEGVQVVGETDLTSNRNVLAGVPSGIGALDPSGTLIVSRSQYVIGYNTLEKVPRWTAWQVKASDIGSVERSDDFVNDTILDGYLKAKRISLGVSPADYTNTCFDRGHQSPAKDRSRTVRDNNATFYMSNMAPQTAFLNRGIWKDFESHARDLVEQDGKRIQVIAGSILKDGREKIGPNADIAVPTKFFKILVVYPSESAKKPEGYLAVIMPNTTADGLDPLAEKDINCAESSGSRQGSLPKKWSSYQATLEEVAAETKMKFPELEGLAQL